MHGALLENASPAGFIGCGPEGLSVGAREFDHRDASSLLSGNVSFVLPDRFRGLRLDRACRVSNKLLLGVVEPAPRCLVNQDAHLSTVEAGIDPVFGFFLPAEIEDSSDRPAIAIDHPSLE